MSEGERKDIADTIARVDSEKWGTPVPPEGHPFWQTYLAYADAVLGAIASSAVAPLEQLAEEKAGMSYTEGVDYQVVGDWGVDGAESEAGARAAVAKWLRAYPKCGAYAQQRVVREWEDGSEFYGPWTNLT